MMEFVFFFFVIPGKVRRVAQSRGESTVKWVMLSWAAWLGVEFFVVVFVVVALNAARYLFSWPDQGLATVVAFAGYVAGLVGGMMAADRVRDLLARRPISVGEEAV